MENNFLRDQLVAADTDERVQLLFDYLPRHGDENYEDIAASFFRNIFPDKVIEPIRLHVAAKRYLCTVNEAYYQGLSEPSQKSFHLQGGNMSAEVPGLDSYRHIVGGSLLPWKD